MKKVIYFACDYYDRQVIQRIIDEHGMDPMEATRSFLMSKTHELMEDCDYGLLSLPDRAIYDMWKTEQETGNPRDSVYIQGE